MGALYSTLFGRKEKTPVRGCGERIVNLWATSFRGIIGFLGLVVILALVIKLKNEKQTVKAIWFAMIWIILWHPLHYAAAGFIPIAFLPIMGVLSTNTIVTNVFNQGTFFFVTGGYLIMILNCCGLDKRLAYCLLTFKDNKNLTSSRLILNASFAAWILGMFSSRVMSTEVIMNAIIPALENLQSASGREDELNYAKLKYQLCNAIASSSNIGSIATIHSSPTVMAFRAMYQGISTSQADTFNFLSYSIFAIPFSITAFLVNVIANIVMVKICCSGKISESSRGAINNAIKKQKESIPSKLTCHEHCGIYSMVILLVGYVFRWHKAVGWSTSRTGPVGHPIPQVHDVTWSSIMIILLCVLPNQCAWVKKVCKLKKSEYHQGGKPASAIVFWRFVDKNMSYAHLFLLCGGIALCMGVKRTTLYATILEHWGKCITNLPWPVGILIIIFVTAILSNLMVGIGVVIIAEPYILHMVQHANLSKDNNQRDPWDNHMYLAAMAVGVASSFGFCARFRLTPSYFSKTIGKVPLRAQICSAALSVIVCTLLLFIFVAFLASFLIVERNDIG